MTESDELEHKIRASEEAYRTVVIRRNSSWFGLAISVALFIYIALKINSSPTYLLIAVLCLLYIGLNVWRILRFGVLKRQIESDLSGYRSQASELQASPAEETQP